MARTSSKKIKSYWDARAKRWSSDRRATTNDYLLRDIEIRSIKKALSKIKGKKTILDIGCGDGFSTIQLARAFPKLKFLGGDYSEQMIKNAQRRLKKETGIASHTSFQVIDMNDLHQYKNKFDVVISDRSLINLPTTALQKKALLEISNALTKNGHYIMVENFISGHRNMNIIRKQLGLEEIPVRWHNRYIDEKFVEKTIQKLFTVEYRENISSLYYLITRIVYSKLCALKNRTPRYNHAMYHIATDIDESLGNFGPVNLLLLKK